MCIDYKRSPTAVKYQTNKTKPQGRLLSFNLTKIFYASLGQSPGVYDSVIPELVTIFASVSVVILLQAKGVFLREQRNFKCV